MTTMLFSHPVCLLHDTGDYHPECAERLQAVLAALDHQDFASLIRREAPEAARDHLLRAHCAHHVDHFFDTIPEPGGFGYMDPDTVISYRSGEAALRAAGAAIAAVDAVMEKQATNAFCAIRPPGHHAERDAAMGFCFFNNAAIAALHARDHHGCQRVAVVDFDVHHGNGTQHILWDEAGTFYGSTHQEHSFPNTGLAHETGGQGVMVNVPLPAGTGSDDFRQAFDDVLIAKLRDFQPDFLIISAGFDAHMKDPLAHLRLQNNDFRWATEKLLDVAADMAAGRVVSLLEGGYDPPTLASVVAIHVKALMDA